MDGIVKNFIVFLTLILLTAALVACGSSQPSILRLATTTSTYDSGLLDAIIPVFERDYDASVEILAVGTGQAIALGENGDVDVLLVHARSIEDAFLASGYGTQRWDIMYNDFILVGPWDDPAGVRGTVQASDAFKAIAQANASFASRGDDSGTYTRELTLWDEAGIQPSGEAVWYYALGQGMGATLQFANERGAYTLTDRGTFIALQEGLLDLDIMVGGESIADNADLNMRNPYGVIPVNPEMYLEVNVELAQKFVDWLTSVEIQGRIAEYGVEKFGQPLFYPNSQIWHDAHP